jgi:hypothetical protein
MCDLKIVPQTDGADGRLPTVAPLNLLLPFLCSLLLINDRHYNTFQKTRQLFAVCMGGNV